MVTILSMMGREKVCLKGKYLEVSQWILNMDNAWSLLHMPPVKYLDTTG